MTLKIINPNKKARINNYETTISLINIYHLTFMFPPQDVDKIDPLLDGI